jgi:hypothetical protein
VTTRAFALVNILIAIQEIIEVKTFVCRGTFVMGWVVWVCGVVCVFRVPLFLRIAPICNFRWRGRK